MVHPWGKAHVTQSVRRRLQRRRLTFPINDFLSGTTRPLSTKLGRKYAWGIGIQICSTKFGKSSKTS